MLPKPRTRQFAWALLIGLFVPFPANAGPFDPVHIQVAKAVGAGMRWLSSSSQEECQPPQPAAPPASLNKVHEDWIEARRRKAPYEIGHPEYRPPERERIAQRRKALEEAAAYTRQAYQSARERLRSALLGDPRHADALVERHRALFDRAQADFEKATARHSQTWKEADRLYTEFRDQKEKWEAANQANQAAARARRRAELARDTAHGDYMDMVNLWRELGAEH